MNVLIICNKNDQSEFEVVDWLYYYGVKTVFVDFIDFVKDYKITRVLSNDLDNFEMMNLSDGAKIPIRGIWYRRNSNFKTVLSTEKYGNKNICNIIEEYIDDESNALKRIFWNPSPNAVNGLKFLSHFDTFSILDFGHKGV